MLDRARLAEELEAAARDRRREHDRIIREIVEIADGIERLSWKAPPGTTEMLGSILQQIHEVLLAQGISNFRPKVGDLVDGKTCEVMATTEAQGLRAGAVSRVLRAGYQMGDRVVRRAGVEVVKE
jgi:molecular chaperone GrpE (heat shock protein)